MQRNLGLYQKSYLVSAKILKNNIRVTTRRVWMCIENVL